MTAYRSPLSGPILPRLAVLTALVATMMAGCADQAASAAADDDLFGDQGDDVASGKGVIRGVVVDLAIVPVPDAEIRLSGRDLSVSSNEQGAFFFSDLEPGTYFVEVSKPGWSSVQQSVDVVADVARPPVIKVQLTEDPSSAPRADTFVAEGFVQCGIGTPLTLHECPGLNDQDKSTLTIPFSGQPDAVQVEVLWESTQPAGEELYLIIANCGDPCAFEFGQRFDEGVYASPHVARTGNVTAGQVGISASPGGPANGTGIALDQTFYAYVTVFYNMEADEGWTFHADGEHPA